MGFFKKRSSRGSDKSEYRNLTLADKELLKSLGVDYNEDVSPNKLRDATYFACLKIMSSKISQPIHLYQDTGNGINKLKDHYLTDLIQTRPNKNMNPSDFWSMIEFQKNHYGHAIALIETAGNGNVTSLIPIDMRKVTIWIDDAKVFTADAEIWYVVNINGRDRKFMTEEVLHFKGFTADGIQGMAVKDYLRTTIENLQYGAKYQNEYFKGGLSAKGLLHYTSDLEPTAVNRMKKRMEDMSTGLKNAGKILPIPIGFQFSSINTTMADAQFLELNGLSIRQIASAFGIKQHMLNDLTGAKFNNVQQQNEEFYRDTLLPIFTMYEQELNYKLLTPNERKSGIFILFNVDAILRTDLKTRYEAYGVGIDKGFLKPNEARAKENLPASDGGDRLIVNGTMQPLEHVGMAYTTTEPSNEEQLEGGEKE